MSIKEPLPDNNVQHADAASGKVLLLLWVAHNKQIQKKNLASYSKLYNKSVKCSTDTTSLTAYNRVLKPMP